MLFASRILFSSLKWSQFSFRIYLKCSLGQFFGYSLISNSLIYPFRNKVARLCIQTCLETFLNIFSELILKWTRYDIIIWYTYLPGGPNYLIEKISFCGEKQSCLFIKRNHWGCYLHDVNKHIYRYQWLKSLKFKTFKVFS